MLVTAFLNSKRYILCRKCEISNSEKRVKAGTRAVIAPIWSEPASLTAIRAMLTHPELINDPAKLRHLGIEQVRRARRISVGRFMNFARAEMVG